MSTDSAIEISRCAHHWIIETANGPESIGECQICHEVRGFANSIDEMKRALVNSRNPRGRRKKGAATSPLPSSPDDEPDDTEQHDEEEENL